MRNSEIKGVIVGAVASSGLIFGMVASFEWAMQHHRIEPRPSPAVERPLTAEEQARDVMQDLRIRVGLERARAAQNETVKKE